MTRRLVFLALCFVAGLAPTAAVTSKESNTRITIRTEQYPRSPYKVCNKFDECRSSYRRGSYKATTDQKNRNPYGTSPAVLIAPSKLGKHVCLVRYKLIGAR